MALTLVSDIPSFRLDSQECRALHIGAFAALLELKLHPNFLRHSTLFACSFESRISRPSSEGDKSCPAVSIVGTPLMRRSLEMRRSWT